MPRFATTVLAREKYFEEITIILAMNTYIYTGQDEIELPGVGVVKEGDTIETVQEINHPLFELKKNKKDK